MVVRVTRGPQFRDGTGSLGGGRNQSWLFMTIILRTQVPPELPPSFFLKQYSKLQHLPSGIDSMVSCSVVKPLLSHSPASSIFNININLI